MTWYAPRDEGLHVYPGRGDRWTGLFLFRDAAAPGCLGTLCSADASTPLEAAARATALATRGCCCVACRPVIESIDQEPTLRLVKG